MSQGCPNLSLGCPNLRRIKTQLRRKVRPRKMDEKRDWDSDRDRDSSRRDRKRDRDRSDSDSDDSRSRRRKRDRRKKKRGRDRSRDRRRRKRSRRRYSSESESSDDKKPRKKKGGNWDQGPASGFGMPGVIPGVAGLVPNLALGLNPMLMQANQHAQRQARRVYLGNITSVIKEDELIAFLNDKIKGVPERMAPSSTAPVLSVSINREKAYAFVEFQSEQDADIAVCMDGILYKGCLPLKIRRPKDYVAPSDGKLRQYHVSGIVSTQVEDGPNKIFIGNLPPALTEMEIKEFLSAYGELKAFHLVKDIGTGMPKGYAFFTYANAGVTDDACKGLNGIQLGDKKLVCQRANVGAKPNPNAFSALMGTGLMGGGLLGGMPGSVPGMGAPGLAGMGAAAALLLQAQAPTIIPTRVLVLQNMVTPEDIKDDAEYKDILEDIREECSQYGTVQKLFVPRPAADPNIPVKGLGKVFVVYASAKEAEKADKAIFGRKFSERTILTRFLKEDEFEAENFDALT